MKQILFTSAWLFISPILCAPPVVNRAEPVSIQTAAAEAPVANGIPDDIKSTVFNGVEVPPMKELSGDQFDTEIKDGYWFVKHHSPWCAHCLAFAPIWQTLYEFYYTSKPAINIKSSLDSQSSLNSFHPYYNFHFASLNCVAYGDACQRHNVNSFPQMLLYKDGELFKKFTGVKDMEGVSSFIEDTLEAIRPGSRPAGGLKLPEVGATGVDTEAIPDVILSKDKNIAAGESMGATHNEKASATKYQQHPESTAVGNLIGTSVPLSAESFQSLVTTTQDPWFIKFYAPWCHHCQAMAPNWAQLGKEMKGKLNIGEVNCDAETRLCKDVKLRGYPTILFFRGGERVEYDGLRGLGDLVSFAKKAIEVGDGVKRVNELDFVEMEKTEEVIFVYFYDHATTAEDFAAIERLTLSLIGHAKIVKTDDKNLAKRFKISTWPRLLVSRDGRPSYYTALAPKDMREYRRVLSWMKTVWLPIVPELTASNSREIMDGRIVVLGILTRDKDSDFISAKREIKNAALEWMEKQTLTFQLERQELRDAKKLRIEEAEDRGDQRALRAAKSIRVNMNEHDRKEVGFAWVDGVFWERWIRTTYGFEVKDGERVVINDEDNRRYWDITSNGGFIVPSRTSILETLPKIVANPPKLKPKSTTGSLENVFFQLRAHSNAHPYVSVGILIGVVVGLLLWGRGRLKRSKSSSTNGSALAGGFFRLDGKEGLLGVGTANGKVD